MAVPRRVVTLLPAATEIVAALSGRDGLVGVSHECDYPAWVAGLPRVTATPIDPEAPAANIDAEVRRLRARGRPVIAVDAGALGRLRPDLILTQALCEVCAVADGEVHRLGSLLDPPPEIIALSASTLGGIWTDIRRIGSALDRVGEARELTAGLERRLACLERLGAPARRPRVLCIEWLEPAYTAGHWVPELVAAAGADDVGANPGAHSVQREWAELAALEPDLIFIMLCGFGVERASHDLDLLNDPVARRLLEATPVWVLDGNAYTSRPGPRVVDGAERMRAALEGRELPGLRRWRPARAA